MLKGPSGNAMGLKAGNSQSGALQTKWNGKRPPGYSPKKLNGAIILGTGGDGSNNAKGTFFEGAITTATRRTLSTTESRPTSWLRATGDRSSRNFSNKFAGRGPI